MNHFRKGSLLHVRSLWVFGRARWLIGVVLFVLGAIGTFLGLPDLSTQLRTDLPGLRCWFPVPMDESNFTIVMSPFVTVDQAGQVSTTQDGRQLARLLYARLENSFAGLNLNIPYELRSPDQTCPVEGSTSDARAVAAEEWAKTIHADVVIYGAIQKGPDESELQPEFYVDYRGFSPAADLIGPHELGRPLRVTLPVEPDALQGVADHPVNVRAQALSLITLGLASFAVDDYDRALDYFSDADQLPNWPASAGKEMLYMLMGNTASRLATTTLDSAYVDEALDYFDKALEIEPDFARALVGQGSALYQLAFGNLQTRKGSQIDTGLLDEAEATFRRAADVPAPEAAEIPLKVHLGLGQIFQVRAYIKLDGGDWLAKARAEFQAMIDTYNAGSVRNRDLIGHAYARMALIANDFDKDPQAAITLYQSAIELVSPHWQAQYQISLGDLYVATNDVENARKAYESAQAVAELYSNNAMIERAGEKLAALP